MRAVVALFSACFFACSAGNLRDVPDEQDGGARTDAGPKSDAGAPTFDAPATCRATPVLDRTIDLESEGRVQTRPAAAFDGRVWLSYSRGDADGSGGFDVFLARLGCDGTIEQAPTRVNTATGTNDSASRVVASSHGGVVAWLTDDSNASPLNLSIRFRRVSPDGAPLGDTETVVKTTGTAGETDANAWLPSLSLLPGGAFAIAGARALPGGGSFNAFVQRFKADGARDGSTIDLASDPPGQHADTALATLADGTLVAAFTRDDFTDSPTIFHTRIDPGATTAPAAVLPIAGRGGDYPWISAEHVAGGRAYLAFTSKLEGASTVLVTDATRLDAGAPSLELGPAHALAFAATVAAAPGGGAVAWISRTTTATQLRVQRFTYDGTTFAAATDVLVPTTGAPYVQASALVHVGGTVWFIGWSEGTHPALRVKGRFVDLR